MIKSPKEFNPELFYKVLFACSNSCQDIFDILNDITKNEKDTIAPSLIFLYSKLFSEKLFVDLLMIKSNMPCVFHEKINNRPWLSTIIESEQLNQPILSHIFAYKQQE